LPLRLPLLLLLLKSVLWLLLLSRARLSSKKKSHPELRRSMLKPRNPRHLKRVLPCKA
jgi:hypothetical protein